MKRLVLSFVLAAALLAAGRRASAFCGFYVAKADAKLYNHASQVALVRNDDKTVLTMANDFKGDPREFAVVVPVPTFIERGQIHIADKALLDHLDAYSAPRLVEYFDEDPCLLRDMAVQLKAPAAAGAVGRPLPEPPRRLGVKIEASYTIGEYDILILSAEQSGGLAVWLRENGYRVPAAAERALGGYIKQGMRFFVAKVNVKEQVKLGFNFLRPIQVAYQSPKFMLPIRLGMVNADGAQELFVYALTRKGRVETTNYRTVRLPSGSEVPLFVKNEFAGFYRALFDRQVRRESMQGVFLEYAWDMAWCDPCAAEPLSSAELRGLGVFWLDPPADGDADGGGGAGGGPGSGAAVPMRKRLPRPGQAQDVFLTRLHLRYDGAHFPEDLVFQETADRENFQGRYVLRHPWTGGATCEAARAYRTELRQRQETEAQTLATLTGWNVMDIRRKMNLRAERPVDQPDPWWKGLWKN
jgi:hypothetical protein